MRSSVIFGFSSAFSFALIQSTRALSFSMARGCRLSRRMRCAITRAIIAGVSSESAGSSQSPCGRTHSPFSSNLPTTRGRTSSRQL